METIKMYYQPVPDLDQALEFYCGELGRVEQWREGHNTAAVAPVGSSSGLMLDVSTADTDKPGPILRVENVRKWLQQRSGRVLVAEEPAEIPGSWWAAVEDSRSGRLYVIDQSTS